MSRTYKDRHRHRDHRNGQLCPRCGYKNARAKLEFCKCGCKAKTNNNLLCRTCWWTNF